MNIFLLGLILHQILFSFQCAFLPSSCSVHIKSCCGKNSNISQYQKLKEVNTKSGSKVI
jgi:hypothetical protein